MATDPIAIDISHHQPDPDWPALAASGIAGVILKATEGNTYVDPTYEDRRQAARDAGLAVASYHFMRPGSMVGQMNHYLAIAAPSYGERVVLDHEDVDVSLADLEACVEYLAAERSDLQVAIYSGHVIKDQLGSKHSPVLAKTALWLAHYSPVPSWPTATWPQWSLWQYTDKGSIAGIEGNVDLNRFNGPDDAALAWFGPVEAPVAPAQPEPAPREQILVAITAPPGSNIVVTVNGDVIAQG